MASGTTTSENSQNLLETIGCTILNSQNYQNYTVSANSVALAKALRL